MKESSFILKLFPSLELEDFTSSEGAFLHEDDYNFLANSIGCPPHELLYGKISCTETLSRFTAFTQIDKLVSSKVYLSGTLYLHRDLAGDIIDTGALQVNIEPFFPEILPHASSIKLKANKSDVQLWADDEIAHARVTLPIKNRVVKVGQKLLLNPRTKSKVAAIVEKINGQTEDSLYQLSADCSIIIEGLPELRQKVLEFNDIGGLESVISRLREIIQLPLNFPDIFQRFNLKPYRGILLYGPPGNGKTMIARALARSLGAKFFPIEGPELMSKHVSVGERELRRIFEEAEENGSSIIFIDEIDAIAVNRNDDSQDYEIRFVSTLLNLMDGMRSGNGVLVIGATNRLSAIDPAFRRPGRFDLDFEVPLPDASARFEIFKIYCNTLVLDGNVDESFLMELCNNASGFSGADLAGVYRESAMNAIRRHCSVDTSGKLFFSKKIEELCISKEDLSLAFYNFIAHEKRTPIQWKK